MKINFSFVYFDLYNIWKDEKSFLFIKLIDISFRDKDPCFAKEIVFLVERGLIINSKIKPEVPNLEDLHVSMNE